MKNYRLLLVLITPLIGWQFTQAQTVTPWLTRGDQATLLSAQPTVSFGGNTATTNATVTVDEGSVFQSIDGFGFCLTQGSAEVINGLDVATRSSLLAELFGPDGLGLSALRISIGASDLSGSLYTYNETAGDVSMNDFSLAGPDADDVLPLLLDVLAINPELKVLATPWTAPTWMKTNGTWIGGSLDPAYYAAYATYFVKYLEAMQTAGIPVWAITPQNEPENPFNEPSMTMTASEQTDFIENHLGPAIQNGGFGTKIIAFDHNCDNPAYPIQVLNGTSYAEGGAFHLYGGDISAMTQVREATGKNVYFTEQYTDVNGNFSGDLGWHIRNVVIGSLNNWSRTVFEWNLATNVDHGPRTPGGCADCLGALTITGPSTFNRNVSYYIIGQVAKFVSPGAVRLGTSSNSGQIHAATLRNPDGSTALIVYNDRNNNKSVRFVKGGAAFDYTVPKKSVMTFVWTEAVVTDPPAAPSGLSALATGAAGITLNWTDNSDNENGFELETSPDGNSGWTALSTPASNETEFTHSGLTPATTYFYRLRSYNAAGSSVWSNVANATTEASSGGFTGTYNIIARHSNKGLDVVNLSPSNNANVQQYEVLNGGGDNQRWTLSSVGGDTYTVQAVHSGLCLALQRRRSDNVVQKTCDGGNAQRWTLSELGDGYYGLENQSNGKLLSVANGSTTNGANVITAAAAGTGDQDWRFDEVLGIRSASDQLKTGGFHPALASLTVFPNPADTGFQFVVEASGHAVATARLYDASGRLVRSLRRDIRERDTLRMDCAQLPAGSYQLKVWVNDSPWREGKVSIR